MDPDCSGAVGAFLGGYSGDSGAATSALLNGPVAVHIDAAGNMYISDMRNHRIRKVDTAGIITTVAGTDVTGTAVLTSSSSMGVYITSGADNNTVGGTVPGTRNIISGHTHGIQLGGAGVTGNVVQGNYIGTDITGTVALGNIQYGVYLLNGPTNNTIGGTNPSERNIVSGNGWGGVALYGAATTANVVQGNYIGTAPNGTDALGNNNTGGFHSAGVRINQATNNTIGGANPGEGNLISGNLITGITISSALGNVVQGNLIGVDATGIVTLQNKGAGIFLRGASSTTIGGTAAGAGNVIAGNFGGGVALDLNPVTTLVQGNHIGTDLTGTIDLGNYLTGVSVSGTDHTIGGNGAGNTIAYNGKQGVQIFGTGATGNLISSNAIYLNDELGIELDTDGVTANDGGDADTGATTVSATLNSAPNTIFAIELLRHDIR